MKRRTMLDNKFQFIKPPRFRDGFSFGNQTARRIYNRESKSRSVRHSIPCAMSA